MDALKRLFSKSTMIRLISGILLVAVAFVTVHLGGNVLFATCLIVSLAGAYELFKTANLHFNVLGICGYISIFCYYMIIRFTDRDKWVVSLLIVTLVMLFFAYVFSYPKIKLSEITLILFGVVYVGIMFSYLYKVRITPDGRYVVWLIFLSSWGCDTCAYIAGVMFGKHKMSPILSPKKTVEGAIGGVFGSVILSFIYALYVEDKIHMHADVRLVFVLACFVSALFSMVGDLTASAIKREKNIKDYSNLIPGHGGVLDRFDSVLFTAPLVWLLVEILH